MRGRTCINGRAGMRRSVRVCGRAGHRGGGLGLRGRLGHRLLLGGGLLLGRIWHRRPAWWRSHLVPTAWVPRVEVCGPGLVLLTGPPRASVCRSAHALPEGPSRGRARRAEALVAITVVVRWCLEEELLLVGSTFLLIVAGGAIVVAVTALIVRVRAFEIVALADEYIFFTGAVGLGGIAG
jgi:hypothetical protein